MLGTLSDLTLLDDPVEIYITLGFAAIGNEIENPFGTEVNDLPMELYYAQIAPDIAIISSRPPARLEDHAIHADNKPLYPISSKIDLSHNTHSWQQASQANLARELSLA
ncbi:hypothetical protein EK21DRAFT_118058 [Setomelanomma holmii]|uniref:Uncharacterized protein n=1 Tax=Setomelanomma holmii TaxID=210430 RepID=A0A9P4GZT2_9PLEO|nr:hypothetical protein EK21DRAFT_118058 [Setomelanomma holmii]